MKTIQQVADFLSHRIFLDIHGLQIVGFLAVTFSHEEVEQLNEILEKETIQFGRKQPEDTIKTTFLEFIQWFENEKTPKLEELILKKTSYNC